MSKNKHLLGLIYSGTMNVNLNPALEDVCKLYCNEIGIHVRVQNAINVLSQSGAEINTQICIQLIVAPAEFYNNQRIHLLKF